MFGRAYFGRRYFGGHYFGPRADAPSGGGGGHGPSSGHGVLDAVHEELYRRRKARSVAEAKAAEASEAAAELTDRLREAALNVAEGKKADRPHIRLAVEKLVRTAAESGATFIDAEVGKLNAAIRAARQERAAEEQLFLAAQIAAEIERQLLDEEEAILVLILA